MRISDWSSDVCSSDLTGDTGIAGIAARRIQTLDAWPGRTRRGVAAIEKGMDRDPFNTLAAGQLKQGKNMLLVALDTAGREQTEHMQDAAAGVDIADRKSTRLNSSH